MNAIARIDPVDDGLREIEDRAWLQGRFEAMVTEVTTSWHIAQEIVANWTEGHNVSALPESDGKYPGEVFREWLDRRVSTHVSLARPSATLLSQQLAAARIKRVAPEKYQDLEWSLYRELPAKATVDEVADIFARAEAQPVGITQRSLRLVQGRLHGMKPPYWQRVIDAAMSGEYLLTPADARNLIATLQHWLEEHPDAPTRR